MAKVYSAPPDYQAPDFSESFVDGRFDSERYDRLNEEYIAKLAERCRQNGSSQLLGEVIRFQRGDGYAQYMVWNTRPLELIHLPIGDAWQVEDALIRGLRVSDVREQVEGARRFREMLVQKKGRSE